MANTDKKIEGPERAWDEGLLGRDANFAKISDLDPATVDQALGLKTVSIRLQPELLNELEMTADINGLGFHPLIKQILHRFVDTQAKEIISHGK